MRVPGNERAFTVRPAGGIPFPQLVCIGASGAQSQAFPVSGWARPAAALLELARAPPRATVRSPGPDSVAAPTAPCSGTHADPRTHTCTRCHACPKPGPGADPTPGSHARGSHALGGFAGRSGATGGRGPGDPETGIERRVGLGNHKPCPEKPEAWRPAGRRRPASPGLLVAMARLWEPGRASRNGPQPVVHCSPWAKPPSPGRTGWDSTARGPESWWPGRRGSERLPRLGEQLRRSGTKSFK